MIALRVVVIVLVVLGLQFSAFAEPRSPRQIQAVSATGGIHIEWLPPKGRVIGYWLYRAQQNGSFGRVNLSPLKTPFYEDRAVETGSLYHYMVSAVDGNGQEGPCSDSVQVVVTAGGATGHRY